MKMNIETPSNDLIGRMISCQQRATMIGHALQAIATSELEEPDDDALYGMGDVAHELALEIKAIQAAYTRQADAHGLVVE